MSHLSERRRPRGRVPSRLRTRSGARGQIDESIVSVARAEVVGLDEVEEEVAARTAGAPAVPAEGPGPRTAGAPGIVELVDQHVVPLALAGAVVRVALCAVAATIHTTSRTPIRRGFLRSMC